MSLAAFAVHPARSQGRLHPESPDLLRDVFEVDRQRILASSAFRRLQYKTQVFVNVEQDHFRTRLTHTLEVVEIARTLAVNLGANEHLTEAIALAHDLGHPPFGHAGESALSALMSGAGGFEHNLQSLRVVDYLEHPFPPFRGLNLSFELREGIIKHRSIYDDPRLPENADPEVTALFETGRLATIEGQIVSLADRIAYDCHDIEDAIGAGLISRQELADVPLWVEAEAPICQHYPELSLPAVRRPILSGILDNLLGDAIEQTHKMLRAGSISDAASVRNADAEVVTFSPAMLQRLEPLERFLADRVYRHQQVMRADADARATIERLFEYYTAQASRLPPRFAWRVPTQGVHRVVGDYIAGMTDRFCRRQHARVEEEVGRRFP